MTVGSVADGVPLSSWVPANSVARTLPVRGQRNDPFDDSDPQEFTDIADGRQSVFYANRFDRNFLPIKYEYRRFLEILFAC